jgi:hypothetical protein
VSVVASSFGVRPVKEGTVEIREERQASPVEEPVSALIAVTRPIITGLVQSLSAEIVGAWASRDLIPLHYVGRLWKKGDGDMGIAFEYAIHEAVQRRHPVVLERITDALKLCNNKRGDPASNLFAIEKQGAKQLIGTDLSLITDNSRALSGKQGQPVKLKKHLNQIAAAFRRPSTRLALPQSINGLWKADLFLGSPVPDHWVGTTVKVQPKRLEAAAGLRIAIIPAQAGKSDAIWKDDARRLVVCPIPYDQSFMQTFQEGWRLVQSLCAYDFKMPPDASVPSAAEREAARIYVQRRTYPVGEVLQATQHFAQPHLLDTRQESVPTTAFATNVQPGTATIVSPFPLQEALF